MSGQTAEPVHAADAADAGARFIRGGIVRLLGFGLGLVFSLASVPLVTRHLGPSGYGYFGTVTAIVFIIAGFTEAGLTTLAIREYANRDAAGRTALLRNVIGLRISATAAAVLIAAGVAALIGSPSAITIGVLVAGAGLIVTIVAENFTIPLYVGLRLPMVSLLDTLRLGVLAATYVVMVVLGAGVITLLGATIISGSALLALSVLLLRRQVVVRPSFDIETWRHLLKRTLPYAVAAAVGIVYFREALVLIPYLSTSRQAGYYAAAFRIVEVLTTLPWMIVTASFPILVRAAHNDPARLRYASQRLFEVALLLGSWMALCVLVGAPLAIAVIGGADFKPAVGVLEIQGIATLTSFLAATFGFSLLSLQLYRSLLVSNAVAVFVATVVAVALIPGLGARGAAIAPSAAEGVLAVAYAICLARHDRSLRVSLGIAPKVALAAGAAIGAAYAVTDSSVLRILIATAVYTAIAFALRALPFELWHALRGGMSRPRTAPAPTPPDQP
jgi:O-antigen/teichoic acid export membrane protein